LTTNIINRRNIKVYRSPHSLCKKGRRDLNKKRNPYSGRGSQRRPLRCDQDREKDKAVGFDKGHGGPEGSTKGGRVFAQREEMRREDCTIREGCEGQERTIQLFVKGGPPFLANPSNR
jgi:hypothetical protein